MAPVAVAPGWMRTELVLAGHDTDEARWRERPALASTESPRYLGRAVVALATDERVLDRSGEVLRVGTSRPPTTSPTSTVGSPRRSSCRERQRHCAWSSLSCSAGMKTCASARIFFAFGQSPVSLTHFAIFARNTPATWRS